MNNNYNVVIRLKMTMYQKKTLFDKVTAMKINSNNIDKITKRS